MSFTINSIGKKSKTPFYEANTFAELPPAADHDGETYQVITPTGTLLLGTKKKSGAYRSNGVSWARMGVVLVSDTTPDAEKTWSSRRVQDSINLAGVRINSDTIDTHNSKVYAKVGAGVWFGLNNLVSPVVFWCSLARTDGPETDNDAKFDIKIVDIESGLIVFEKIDNICIDLSPCVFQITGFQNISNTPAHWEVSIRNSTGVIIDREFRFYGGLLRDI